MIKKIGKITIYVNNQGEAVEFWTKKVNFVITFEQAMGPNMKWIEVGPSQDEFTTFVLYDKNAMRMQNPDMKVNHPNIILRTDDIDVTYEQLKENGVKVSELNRYPYGSMFSFEDQDGNTYLVREDK